MLSQNTDIIPESMKRFTVTPLTIFSVLALFVCAAHLALSGIHNSRLAADDDRLFLYLTGIALTQQDEVDSIEETVQDAITRAGLLRPDYRLRMYTERFGHRQHYGSNYLAGSILYRTGAWLTEESGDYPDYLGRALFSGFWLSYTVFAIIFLGIFFCFRNSSRFITALVTAISVMAGLDILFYTLGDPMAGTIYLMPPNDRLELPLLDYLATGTIGGILNPDISLGPFGDTPRHHFILLTLVLYALRWSGRFTASYTLLFALSFLHQSLAGLLFGFLVTADMFLRPHLFSQKKFLMVIGAILVTFLARDKALDLVVGFGQPAVTAALVIGIIVAGIMTASMVLSGPWNERIARLRTRVMAFGPITADVIVVGTLFAASYPFAYVVNFFVDVDRSIYFWAQIHGRALSVMRPGIVLACCLFFVRQTEWTSLRSMRPLIAQLLVAALLLLPSGWLALSYDRQPIARMTSQLRELDREVGSGTHWDRLVDPYREPEILYLMARTLKENSLQRRVRTP